MLDSRQRKVCTSAEEDSAYLQALTQLSAASRTARSRVLDSDFTAPPPGTTAAQWLKSEATSNYAAYDQAIESACRVASPVVCELAEHWSHYRDRVPEPQP